MTTLRWIFVLPATVVVHFLFSTVLYNLQHVVGWFGAPFIFLRVSWAAFCGLAAGVWIAPAHRRPASWILFALYSLLTVGILIQLAMADANRGRWVAGSIEAFGLLFGAWGGAKLWSYMR